MPHHEHDSTSINAAAAIYAWLWPGAGHLARGRRKRGWCIMFGMLLLVVTGLVIGGVDSVDRKEDKLWFAAQAVCGPIVFAADFVNQRYIKNLPYERQLETKGLAHVNEMGTLFIALAGLMNLAVILDALHPYVSDEAERRGGAT